MSSDISNDQTSGRLRAGRSRRGLLAGAAGALGLAAAETLGAATPAQASGPAVQLSTDNTGATGRTAVFTTGNNEWAQLADSGAGSPSAHQGSMGVYGHGQDIGVLGDAGGLDGIGVKGVGSGNGAGVRGEAAAGSDGDGVEGIAHGNGFGVWAVGSGSGQGVYATSLGGGVFGLGGQFSPGVEGSGGTPSGTGMLGNGGLPDGDGVHGIGAGSGAGVLAENTVGGDALKVVGPASFTGPASFGGTTRFSRSGVLTVGTGKSSATMTGVALTSASLVLVTVQQHAAGVYVLAAVPKVSASAFTVYLSKVVPASTKVAWLVVN